MFRILFRTSPNELAALLIGSINLTRIKLEGIGIFTSNITVNTLNQFGKQVRSCCVHVFLVSGWIGVLLF